MSVDIQSRVAALMDQQEYVAMASLDLSAAFDVVNVDLLLARLRKMGLPTDVDEIDKQWINMPRDVYKTECKRRLISEKLLLM